MRSHNEQAIRRYLMLCTILGCAIILIWLVLCHWHLGLLSVLFLLILLIICKITVSIIAKKTLFTVLFDKLDAVEFQKIVNDNRFNGSLIFRTIAAISSGDYQTVVNIATKFLSNKKTNIKSEYYYLSLLARAYFELRDFDKLNLLLKKYDELKALYPSKKLFNTANSIWSYYRYFLDGNFEACKTICREKLLETNSKAWDAKIRKLNNDFTYAVACYENGDKNDAIKSFESIVAYAPKMNASDVAQKYLNNINEQKILEFQEILPETNCEIAFNENKVLKIIKCVGILLVVIGVILIGVSHVDSYKYNKRLQEYENQLDIAISQIYDDFSILGYSNVSIDDQIVDVFCVIETKNGIDVVSYGEYSDGSKVALLRQSNMVINQVYTISSLAGNYLLDVGVYDTNCLENTIVKLKVTYQGESYFFCVTEHISPMTQ